MNGNGKEIFYLLVGARRSADRFNSIRVLESWPPHLGIYIPVYISSSSPLVRASLLIAIHVESFYNNEMGKGPVASQFRPMGNDEKLLGEDAKDDVMYATVYYYQAGCALLCSTTVSSQWWRRRERRKEEEEGE